MKKLIFVTCIAGLSACSLMPSFDSSQKRAADLEEASNAIKAPTIESSMLGMAQDAEKAGDLKKAEVYYSQLLKNSPENANFQYNYAEILRKLGNCDEALNGYNQVLSKDGNNTNAKEGKGLCLLAQGKNTEAADIFSEIIKADSNRWRSLNAAGLIFAADKKYNEAGQYFAAAAQVSNDHPTVLNNQGLLKAIIGNIKEAIPTLQQAVSKAESGAQKRSTELNLALVYGISGNMDMAEKYAKPNLTAPQLYNNMGIYAELAKDKELAKTYLNKAMQETKFYYERAWDNLERIKQESR